LLHAAPVLAPLLSSPRVRELAAAALTRGGVGPGAAQRAARRSLVWGEAVDPGGGRVAALQRHPHPYDLTADAAVEIAARARRGEAPPGWQTPATAYGPDLVLSLPGVAREEA
jgi:short subunit dehydrogenase-like uncharacterized protein